MDKTQKSDHAIDAILGDNINSFVSDFDHEMTSRDVRNDLLSQNERQLDGFSSSEDQEESKADQLNLSINNVSGVMSQKSESLTIEDQLMIG